MERFPMKPSFDYVIMRFDTAPKSEAFGATLLRR
jgi:hypothetical protein